MNPPMSLNEAEKQLRPLAVEINCWPDRALFLSSAEIEALTFAAAFLGVFVESLEEV